jgi:CRP-like cAMP-binding protein
MKVDIEFLRKVAMFADLSHRELTDVSELFKELSYKRNEIIFSEADTGNYMYIVKEGRVKVSRVLPSGKEMILAFHEEGEYFGEMSLIDGGTTPAAVIAVIPTTILSLHKLKFSDLLDNPKVNRALLKMLCRRCRDAWAQIEVLNFRQADARIRTALYNLCQSKGVQTDKGTMINMHLTHKDLAEIAGISREAATRVLSHLQSEKVVTVDERHFVIFAPEELIGYSLV